MGSKWKTSFLTDHYSISSGLSKPAKDFGTGYPFLSFKDIFYNYFLPDSLAQLVQSTDKERASCSVRRGDVFLTRTSETMHELGMSSVALKDYTDATFNGFCKRLRPKETSELEPEYVGYYLRSPVFRQSMLAFSTMSTRASLNNEMISRLEISYPDRKIQKKIANILLSLDEKIAISRAINQSLEQMSQALFKSWFVDFDPVIDNALDAGNQIPEALQSRAELRQKARNCADFKPLSADIRALFPAEFEETELGLVPKGWQLKSMHDLVESVSITFPLSKTDKVIFLNTGDIEKGSFLHQNYSKTEGLPGQAKKSIKKGDILFSEIRPENKRYAFVHFESDDYVVSTKLMVLRAKNEINPLLPYFIITLEDNTRKLQRVAELRSGTFPQITFKELEFINFIMPNDHKIMELFINSYLAPAYNKIIATKKANMNLTNLRDTLLPKLISGELSLEDLPDIIKQTEAA
ncbi:restriction endonuclease subunit S [Enterobacter sp. E-TC7]|uniref:Restriction endonuclease subunit S n=1 Tax=Enterobacter nematophilus TaxID=2994648 RepID=A0ABT3VZ64_9ENTR|nr:restriction endonuclease subunit S [Enterobacter nematophilus]MCX5575074.1 restriction endonuclease subunit S [Enterobacter nematophilus]